LSAPSDSATSTPVDEIVATIAAAIDEIIGEDGFALDVTADSSFSEDVEIESIEFVALAERLQAAYGERIDLIAWLGELDLDEIIDLTVGDLATFIAACLDDGGAGA
jgi:acyl carrier protein